MNQNVKDSKVLTSEEICSRRNENRQMWLGSIIIAICSGVIGLFIVEMSINIFLYFLFFAFSTSVGVWSSNLWVSRLLDSKIPLEQNSKKRLVVQLVLNTFLSFGIVVSLLFLTRLFFGIPSDNRIMSTAIISSLYFTLLVNIIYIGIFFFRKWKESIIDREKMKNLHIEIQLEALKAQMDPHFLFNALTTLSELVYENQDKASEYIEKLSLVYRYILDHKKESLVTIDQELKFLKAYAFLLQIKYGEGLHIQWPIDFPLHSHGMLIPALASQIALENVVKHNLIEAHHPIAVSIALQENSLIIQNQVRLKNTGGQNGKSTGLDNLSRRYHILTERYPEIEQKTETYTIKLPLKIKAT